MLFFYLIFLVVKKIKNVGREAAKKKWPKNAIKKDFLHPHSLFFSKKKIGIRFADSTVTSFVISHCVEI